MSEKLKKYEYYNQGGITIYHGCALEVLKEMDSESVDMCMCSPPYWALRDYGHDGQLGLEPTFQEYINKLVIIFVEVKRVLKDTGSCWVNLGDSYSGSGGDSGKVQGEKRHGAKGIDTRLVGVGGIGKPLNNKIEGMQSKSLIGIPERFAIAMQDSGWIRRNTIIWYKPSCMPSSADDRFTVDFEYLYFFTKAPQYYFEQQFEPYESNKYDINKPRNKGAENYALNAHKGVNNPISEGERDWYKNGARNKRCVWEINPQGYPDAHFATYPEKLCEVPIKAGCPKDGVVLDPFAGSFTTLKVARELGRKGIGIELNEDYIEMGIKRMKLNQALFHSIHRLSKCNKSYDTIGG